VRAVSRALVLGRKALESHYDYRQPNPKKGHPPAPDHPWRKHTRPAPAAGGPDASASREADTMALG
jgi:hypothetical protein